MTKSDLNSYRIELSSAFSGSQFVQKADLRKFYRQHSQAMAEQAFRRFLYGLEKQQVITPIGAGTYAFHDHSSQQATKKKRFSPHWSQELVALNRAVQQAFPYIHYLTWETRVLHEFMVHQPGQNQIIIEAEKDVCESVFNLLSPQYPGRTFLNPDRTTTERYVLHQPNSIIISRLVTQSPKKTIDGIPFPKLEKILVDVYVDEDKYYFLQGEELVHIFENAFSSYWISEKTLFRYAGRRKVSARLREFIHKQTQIELSQLQENAE